MRFQRSIGLLVCLLPLVVTAQFRWDFGGGIGFANILGEMGGKEKTRRDFVSDLKLRETRWDINGFARYKFHPQILLKGMITYARLEGADSLSTNPGRVGRNLHVRNDIFELAITGEFIFYEVSDIGRSYRFRNDLRFYAFAGVGGLYHNPKGKLNGSWTPLRPMMNEGVKYSKITVVVPTGVGLFFTIKREHRIGWELGWRTMFTDYLDDISTTYKDPSTLSADANAWQQQVYNDYASGYDPNNTEMENPNNYAWDPILSYGAKRGDPTHNDSYLFTTFNYSYVLRGKSRFSKSRYSSYFKTRKYKKRKSRAKF
ncbi:MAG: hypothetical protein IT233_11225 [Bacteroidia bacterium]|nr:hypothetical protein [Bacteroidia bacterium]